METFFGGASALPQHHGRARFRIFKPHQAKVLLLLLKQPQDFRAKPDFTTFQRSNEWHPQNILCPWILAKS